MHNYLGKIKRGIARLLGRKRDLQAFDGSFVFISKDRTFITGEEARMRIAEKNDRKYFKQDMGVVEVDKDRWREAQHFEEKTWMTDNRSAKEDSNTAYIRHFDSYEPIAGLHFKNAIELGCGPFTNIRHIAAVADIERIHLLDPLIESYVRHPNCSYAEGHFRIRKGLGSRKQPVITHASSIEEFETDERFDLVVMINVIEHCFDLEKIFEQIKRMLVPGGYFVFYDKYFTSKEINENMEKKFDAGHPLRVNGELLERFLKENFDADLHKLRKINYEKRGMSITYTNLYFIGRKR